MPFPSRCNRIQHFQLTQRARSYSQTKYSMSQPRNRAEAGASCEWRGDRYARKGQTSSALGSGVSSRNEKNRTLRPSKDHSTKWGMHQKSITDGFATKRVREK